MRAFITVGLWYGDEGKGATVDYLCRKFDAGLVVRYSGGAQCGHNVVLPDGSRHPFAQFGAGTLAGAQTYLDQPVIIDPVTMWREAESLGRLLTQLDRTNNYANCDPFRKLLVHKRCLVTTPLHRILNFRNEIRNQHGTCGMGIGATREYWLKYGEDAIFAEDLRSAPRLREKLELLRQRILLDRPNDIVLWVETMDSIRLHFSEMLRTGSRLSLVDCFDIAAWPAVRQGKSVVFEGAQGFRLDEYFGTHPHTTWSDVTPRRALDICVASGFEEVKVIGCTRTYITRHGNGPMENENHEYALCDLGNPYNEFQGEIRHGRMDFGRLQQTIKELNSISCSVDGLAVSCFDHRTVYDGSTADLHTTLNKICPIYIAASGPTHLDRRWVA